MWAVLGDVGWGMLGGGWFGCCVGVTGEMVSVRQDGGRAVIGGG